MRKLLLVALMLFIAGCAKESIPEQNGNSSPSPIVAASTSSLKQTLTCVTNGTDGYYAPYSIQYVLKSYADGTNIASCSVLKGTVKNLQCPSSQPLSITYAIIRINEISPTKSYPYDANISETFLPSSSNCLLVGN